MLTLRFADCNANGVDDSVDIAEHIEDDANGNGEIDSCDPDPAVREFALSDTTWHSYSISHPGDVYFKTSFNDTGDVRIRYTVPEGGSRIRLEVLDHRRKRARSLIAGMKQSAGHYELVWDRSDAKGRQLPEGSFTVHLTVGDRRIDRPLRWR
jgi:hypothetical protein